MRSARRLASLLLPLALLLAPGAGAVPVDVTYDITLSLSVPDLGPNAFFSGPGTLKLRFASGTTGSHASPGPFSVQSGTAALSGSFNVFGNQVTGSQFITNLKTGAGYAGPGGALTANTGAHFVSGFIHCTGPNCATFGFPASSNYPLTSGTQMMALNGTLMGFPSVGPQSISANGYAGTIMGIAVYADIRGQEVSRTVVPEPGRAAMLGAGLLGLAGLGAGMRLRGRSGPGSGLGLRGR